MLEAAEYIWSLLNDKSAHFYVCGDARAMAKEVQQALCTIVMTVGKKSDKEAEKYLADLQSKGRYIQDIWS